jgi:hypothetical protein
MLLCGAAFQGGYAGILAGILMKSARLLDQRSLLCAILQLAHRPPLDRVMTLRACAGIRPPSPGPQFSKRTSDNGTDAELIYLGAAPGQVSAITQIDVRVPPLPPGQYTLKVGWGSPLWDFSAFPFNVGYQ